jgi:sporulation protein YlmC with PRC-barrel domain
MRLSGFRDAKVCTLDGDALGHVHEVHCDGGRIVALMCGPGSFIERLTARKKGRRIPWEYVVKAEPGRITVTSDPPQRNSPKTTNGPRTRRRTPQASGRRSGR